MRLLVGDVRDRIREIPDSSVDLVCTSPPFLALRKYGDGAEMGSEATPALFIDGLLALCAEFRRILTPHGSIAIELGDTYSGSGGAGGDYGEGGLRDGQPLFRQGYVRNDRPNRPPQESPKAYGNGGPRSARVGRADGWPLAKSLAGIPQAFMLSLAYGYNVLDRHSPDSPAGRWRNRNVIVWARPNPPVGALGDKVRPATSYITVACPSARRWFDLDAVRTEAQSNDNRSVNAIKDSVGFGTRMDKVIASNPAGAPPLDWWEDDFDPDDPTDHYTMVLPTQPYKSAHYATWPASLAKRLIELMAPLRVCRICGELSRRIVGETSYTRHGEPCPPDAANFTGLQGRRHSSGHSIAVAPTLGWSNCGHDNWRQGVVLDPFAGSGTTLAVAHGCGRDAIGIELYEANADLIRDRCGMFLEVVA